MWSTLTGENRPVSVTCEFISLTNKCSCS